jgi:hypothetical protein
VLPRQRRGPSIGFNPAGSEMIRFFTLQCPIGAWRPRYFILLAGESAWPDRPGDIFVRSYVRQDHEVAVSASGTPWIDHRCDATLRGQTLRPCLPACLPAAFCPCARYTGGRVSESVRTHGACDHRRSGACPDRHGTEQHAACRCARAGGRYPHGISKPRPARNATDRCREHHRLPSARAGGRAKSPRILRSTRPPNTPSRQPPSHRPVKTCVVVVVCY